MKIPEYLSLENQDHIVAESYLKSGKYEEAITLLKESLSDTTDRETTQEVLAMLAKGYRLQSNVRKLKKTIGQGLKHCDQGFDNANIYYEAAALAYYKGKFDSALEYLDKYNRVYLSSFEDDPETKVKHERQNFSAMLAMRIALGEVDEARTMCTDWLDDHEDLEVTSYSELSSGKNIDACIQHIQDPDLLVRFAESTFLRSGTPSLEFALKGLAAQMKKDEQYAYKCFSQYKTALKMQIEYEGKNFEEVWKEMKSDITKIIAFEITDNDPPLQVVVDEYIEKYGD